MFLHVPKTARTTMIRRFTLHKLTLNYTEIAIQHWKILVCTNNAFSYPLGFSRKQQFYDLSQQIVVRFSSASRGSRVSFPQRGILSVWTHKRCRYRVLEHSQRKYDEIFNTDEWGEPFAFENPYSNRRILCWALRELRQLYHDRSSRIRHDRIKQLTVSPPGVNVILVGCYCACSVACRKGSSRISLVCFANKGSTTAPVGRGRQKNPLFLEKTSRNVKSAVITSTLI